MFENTEDEISKLKKLVYRPSFLRNQLKPIIIIIIPFLPCYQFTKRCIQG